jgi:hypothetical protein
MFKRAGVDHPAQTTPKLTKACPTGRNSEMTKRTVACLLELMHKGLLD